MLLMTHWETAALFVGWRRVELLHQPALAPGGVIRVDDTLLGGAVEGGNGGQRGGLGFLGRGLPGQAHGAAGGAAVDLVADALAVIGPDALDGGSCVGQ